MSTKSSKAKPSEPRWAIVDSASMKVVSFESSTPAAVVAVFLRGGCFAVEMATMLTHSLRHGDIVSGQPVSISQVPVLIGNRYVLQIVVGSQVSFVK